MGIRTRFAPSPTGFLHVGGARTALYSWLYAKKMGGQFILRIEDTDTERSTPEAVTAILEAMEWLELEWDEGPFYQTHHFARYQAVAESLLERHQAYRCYCSKERLESLREAQLAHKEKPRYDGHCRSLPPSQDPEGKPFVIRFRNPEEGEVVIEDCVKGRVVIRNSELDDLIIVRSDGVPTYNFTVVVDDWDMNITHVIRGDDHLNNTPRQINLLKALGATVPVYAHIPMILGDDGKRLSKRHGAESVQQYRAEGILPQALLNYLVRLGWSHGDQEIFTVEELIQAFDIQDINKAPSAFNTTKLLWLNQHYLMNTDPSVLKKHLQWQMDHMAIEYTKGPALETVIEALRERSKTLKEMAEKSRMFYEAECVRDEEACAKHLTEEARGYLRSLLAALQGLTVWDQPTLQTTLEQVLASLNIPLGKLAQPLRVAVTGQTTSPSIDVTLRLLGREKVLKRLESVLN